MCEDARARWDWPSIRQRCLAEARKVLRDHHDAEEVVQEAMARAWRSRDRCRSQDAPLPWCLQITRNEALRLIGRRRHLVVSDPNELTEEIEDQRAGFDTDKTLVRVDVGRALCELTPHERRLIALRYEHDRSHLQIAAELKIPEATARVHLHRALKRLKPLL